MLDLVQPSNGDSELFRWINHSSNEYLREFPRRYPGGLPPSGNASRSSQQHHECARIVLFNGQRAWVGVLTTASYVASVFPVVDENAVALQPGGSHFRAGTVLDVQAVVSSDKRFRDDESASRCRPAVGPLQVFRSAVERPVRAAADAFIQLPNVQRQVIRTTVSVPDGGTLLIGGLKTAQEVKQKPVYRFCRRFLCSSGCTRPATSSRTSRCC
ncbi:MAG: hypothetical protein R3E58_11760 [Phycisphaerae bacterium]